MNHDFFSDINDNNMDVYYSPSSPKWAEKIIQAARELVGNPQEPRKTRSQSNNASFETEIYLDENYYMLIGYDSQSYQQYFHDPIWKTAMEE